MSFFKKLEKFWKSLEKIINSNNRVFLLLQTFNFNVPERLKMSIKSVQRHQRPYMTTLHAFIVRNSCLEMILGHTVKKNMREFLGGRPPVENRKNKILLLARTNHILKPEIE